MTSDPAANEHDLGPAILERTLGRIVSEPSRVRSCQVYSTSFEVNSPLPFWNCTPLRRVKL